LGNSKNALFFPVLSRDRVIEKSRLRERYIVVTNVYLSDIKDFDERSKYLKIFPKRYLNDINLSLRLE
jgi:hypothetical protein